MGGSSCGADPPNGGAEVKEWPIQTFSATSAVEVVNMLEFLMQALRHRQSCGLVFLSLMGTSFAVSVM